LSEKVEASQKTFPSCQDCEYRATGGGKCRALKDDVCPKDTFVEGLVDTLEILEERESKKIADLESSLEELSYSKEPEDKKLIAELMRTKSKHFGLMMAYVNIQGLVGVEAKKQK